MTNKKVMLLAVLAIAGFLLVIAYSQRQVLNEFLIIPIIKPFSNKCGYDSLYNKTDCSCRGLLFKDSRIGSASSYCLGKCNSCKCFKKDYPNLEKFSNEINLKEIYCDE